MFLSATRIEKNKAAGLGVAGRRMEARNAEPEPAATVDMSRESRQPVGSSGQMGVLQRARRRYVAARSEREAA